MHSATVYTRGFEIETNCGPILKYEFQGKIFAFPIKVVKQKSNKFPNSLDLSRDLVSTSRAFVISMIRTVLEQELGHFTRSGTFNFTREKTNNDVD